MKTEEAGDVLSVLVASLDELTPESAQKLLVQTDAEAAKLEAQKDELQRALKAQRAAAKEKVRPLIARLDALSRARLLLVTVTGSQKIG